MAPVIPRHKRPPATTRRQKQGFLGSNAILACVMWPSTPAEWRSLAIAAPRIWPSTAVTVSASAISRITWLFPTPHRLTVYASAAPLPDAPATLVIGRLARPYPSGTFPRRIALTSPSARRLQIGIPGRLASEFATGFTSARSPIAARSIRASISQSWTGPCLTPCRPD
jgi:hypothetical protein